MCFKLDAIFVRIYIGRIYVLIGSNVLSGGFSVNYKGNMRRGNELNDLRVSCLQTETG
jgi:hypothetical protein